MDPNRAHVVPAALPPAQPSSASSSTPAPLKLTFRLGAAGGGVSAAGPSLSAPAPSTSHATFAPSSAASVATTLSPASEPMDRDDNMSVMSDAGSVLGAARVASPVPRPPPGTVSVPVKLPPGEKPKRKRAPKRPPGEVGPGKHWRKGLKGNLVGNAGAPLPERSGSSTGTPTASTPRASGGAAGSSIGPVPKIATSYLPSLALEVRTPKPRMWSKSVKEFTSISGKTLRLKSWQGDASSPYFDSRKQPTPPPSTTSVPADLSPVPGSTPAPPGVPRHTALTPREPAGAPPPPSSTAAPTSTSVSTSPAPLPHLQLASAPPSTAATVKVDEPSTEAVPMETGA